MDFNYDSLLKKAMDNVPKNKGTGKRFKVPQVSTQVQGSRTSIKNFSDVAAGLRREPSHISRYFAKELAVPVSIQSGALVLQAKLSKEALQKKLEDYIKNFVYCRVCGEPDTSIEKQDRIIFLKCDACGAKSAAKPV